MSQCTPSTTINLKKKKDGLKKQRNEGRAKQMLSWLELLTSISH
jgi:hypothetical protein